MEILELMYCQDAYEAARGADAVVILTEWEEFGKVDWTRLASLLERPLIIDGRNTLSRETVSSHGFQYIGVGGVSATPKTGPLLVEALSTIVQPQVLEHRYQKD
jgi:hypothetical protein